MHALLADANRLCFGHIHFSSKYNYIYVDTPKVACSTIKYTLNSAECGEARLEKNDSGSRYGYSDFLLRIHDRRDSPLLFPTTTEELAQFLSSSRLVFCFARNPFTRVLSAYIDKIEKNTERRALFTTNLGREAQDQDQPLSFVEFLELVNQQPLEAMDPHWRLQNLHIKGMHYDVVGAFEQFGNDFDRLLNSIDQKMVSFFAKVDEHKTNASENISRYYSDRKAVQLALDIYEQDFTYFGYCDDIARATEPPQHQLA
jgi:hypothetical protein